jgi:hypothetical protein
MRLGPKHLGDACPLWLQRYAGWHAENRGKPGAGYLVQYCPKERACNGIGKVARDKSAAACRPEPVHAATTTQNWSLSLQA